MNRVPIAKRLVKMEMFCESLTKIFEHVLYGNPPQTINQWIAAQGGWVHVTLLLHAYVIFFEKGAKYISKNYNFTLSLFYFTSRLIQAYICARIEHASSTQ